MAGVRRKRTQKNKRVNSTVNGRKRKKKNRMNVNITSKAVRQSWDQRKTLKQNFKDIGLSYNPNKTIPVRKKEDKNDEAMEVDKVQNKSVIKELEAEASNGTKKEKHISPGEATFLWELIKDHGDNYKGCGGWEKNSCLENAFLVNSCSGCDRNDHRLFCRIRLYRCLKAECFGHES